MISFALLSCKKNIEISDFKSNAFKNAKRSCDSSRLDYIKPLKENQSSFIGVSESSVKELLGRPDEQEILPRMARKYYYYLTPSKKCNKDIKDRPSSIVVDFEHMGRVKLIIIPNIAAIQSKRKPQ